ncbi:hypothetical protein B0H10DRAFT_528224 [Mycena sp. CBHHK59/15]|nr:hypothetical protein B0H10DRAFT_528224 [Mycena sp. CBHHK59/15]
MSTHTAQRSASTSAHLPYTPPRPTVSPVADDEPDEAWKANERSNIESGFKGLIQEAKDRLENALQELHKDGTFSPEKKAALVEAFQLETSFIKSLAKEEFEHNLGRERVTRRLTRGGVINSEVKGGLVEEQAAILEQIQRDRKNQGGPAQTGSPSASSSSPSQRAANVAQESSPRGAPPETGPASRNPPASASSPSTSNRDAPPRSPLPTSSSQEPSRDATAPQSLNGPSTDPRIPPSGSSPFYNGTRLPPSPQAWPMPAQERAPPATSSTFKVAAAALHSPDGVSPDPRAFSAGPSSSFSGTPFSQPPSQANAAPVQEWAKPAPTSTPSYAGASPISPHAPAAPTSASIHRAPTAQTRADASSPPVQAEHRPAVSFPLRSKPSQSSFKAPSVSAGKPELWTRAEFTEEPEELPPSRSEQRGVPVPSARPREMSERPLGSSPPAARPMPEFWTPTVTPEEDAQASRPFGRERSGSSLRSASGSIRRPIPAFTEQAPASSPVVDVNKNAEREAAQRHESELPWNSLSRSREKEKEKAAEARASHRQSTASEQIYRHNNEHVSFPPSHSDGSSTSARPPDSDPGLHSNASSRFPLSSPDSAPSGSLSRAPYSFAASGISATAHPPSGSPASFARPSNGDSPYHASTGYAAEHHQYKPANVDPMPSDVPPAAAYRAPQPYSTSVTTRAAEDCRGSRAGGEASGGGRPAQGGGGAAEGGGCTKEGGRSEAPAGGDGEADTGD